MTFDDLDRFLRATGLKLLLQYRGRSYLCSVVSDGTSLVTGIADSSEEAIADAVMEAKKILQ